MASWAAPHASRRRASRGRATPATRRWPRRAGRARSAASSGSSSLAVLLAGIVAVNVAVLQLNVRLDELGRERVQLRGRHESAQLPALERLGERPDRVAGPREARPRARRPGADLPRAAGAADAMNERRSNRRIRLLLGVFALVFAGTLGPRRLAPGRAGLDARADGGAPAAADDGDPGRPRDDLRPDGRAARDRRAGDDGLRRPAQREAAAPGRARRREGARRGRGDALPAARRPHAPLRLRQAQGRSRRRPPRSRS